MLTSQLILGLSERPLPDRDIGGRFRSGVCASPDTQFKRGQRASQSTEIKPGQRLSKKTEFQPGQAAHNRLPVGSVTIRTLKGVRRAHVKLGEPSKWRERAKVVWEATHGRPVPRGRVIHHRDRDTLNDSPSNLVALSRKEHALEHLADVQAAGFGSAFALEKAHEAKRSRKC